MELTARLLLVDLITEFIEELAEFTETSLNLKLEITSAQSPHEALSLIREFPEAFAVLIINQGLANPGWIEQVKTQNQAIRIIWVCSENSASGFQALQAGADRFFVKPLNLKELGYSIKLAVRHWHSLQTLKELTAQVNTLNLPVTESPGMVESRLRLAWVNMVGSTWGQEVNMNAITIRERVQLCRRFLLDPLNVSKLDESLQVIEDLVTQMLEKSFPAPLGVVESTQRIPLNAFIQARIRQMWNNEPYSYCQYQLNLNLGDNQVVSLSPEWLRKLLELSLQDMVKTANKFNHPLITISSQETTEYAEIVISNKDPEIASTLLPNLVVKPTKKTSDETGQALSLLLVKTIVEAYNGFLRVDSTELAGTNLIISLPLKK